MNDSTKAIVPPEPLGTSAGNAGRGWRADRTRRSAKCELDLKKKASESSFWADLGITLQKYRKSLPWALPTMVLLFDIVDLMWMLGHEPGVTTEAARRFQLLLLPGTLFVAPEPAILINCALAALIGAVLFWATKPRS